MMSVSAAPMPDKMVDRSMASKKPVNRSVDAARQSMTTRFDFSNKLKTPSRPRRSARSMKLASGWKRFSVEFSLSLSMATCLMPLSFRYWTKLMAKKLLPTVNRLLGFLVAFPARVGVERGDDFKPLLFKTAIRQQRESEVADADQNHRLQARCAEFIGDLFGKRRHVIAEAARAERAETGEVFAELGGLDAGGQGEHLAGNGADAVVPQPHEAAQVKRQAINRLARNGWAPVLFQRRR